MAATFLTSTERELYETTPLIEESILRQYFHLSQEDKRFILTFYGTLNRTSIAIQLCLLRYLGYIPQDWQNQISSLTIQFLIEQISIQNTEAFFLKDYTRWGKTRTDHLQQILKYLNFRKWQPIDEPFIEAWLIQQGMEHDNERWLLASLCLKLHQDKVLRPSIGTLERIVGGIDEQLNQETYRRLTHLLKPETTIRLDNLLQIEPIRKITTHRWLCNVPTANTTKIINLTLEKVVFLKEMQVSLWDLSVIPANRRKRLANIARNNSNVYLERIKPIRRYPILVCFLWETLLDTTDSVLVMYDDFWQHFVNGAKKSFEIYQMSLVKSQNQAVQALTKTVEMVVDDAIENLKLRETIFESLSKQQLQDALAVILKINKPINQTYLFFLLKNYSRIKLFTPNFLKILDFEVAFSKDNFKAGLNLVIDLHTGKKRKLPADAPTNFVSQSWQKLVIDNKSIQSQPYELCVLSVLRDRLLSGDVFIKNSRKFADFNSFLISKERWETDAEKICTPLGGLNMIARIDKKVAELTNLLKPLSELLSKATEIRLEDDVLVVPPLSAEEIPVSAINLRNQINLRLPKVGLVEIIQEVDGWTNYSKELYQNTIARNSDHDVLLSAALLGNACNLTLADLARSSDLDYQSLWWVANNYFSDENLKKANNLLVNFQHKQPISAFWGGGTLSSSDGQRFPTNGKIRNAQALPKYFGYGKGVTFYTHTSDQYSQYGSKVISSTERDATYVLDEILTNETDLDIMQHTTDTHGYSDLIFALFDLVDKQFAPRIRDIKNQRLCKIKTNENTNIEPNYPLLKFTGTVNIDYLKKYADELKHVAASLQTGTVTASLFISKLQAYPRQNNLMYVLQSYGQLIKTIFICRYLLELPLRHKINTQLNKGEQLHNLRLYLWFGGDGIIRKKQEKEQQITARSLNLLTNIVMVWNTVYIQEIISELKKDGVEINENDYQHISPAPFEHINRLGKYNFKNELKLGINGLRDLRKPD